MEIRGKFQSRFSPQIFAEDSVKVANEFFLWKRFGRFNRSIQLCDFTEG